MGGAAMSALAGHLARGALGSVTEAWKQFWLHGEQLRCDHGMNANHYLLYHVWKRHRQIRDENGNFVNAVKVLGPKDTTGKVKEDKKATKSGGWGSWLKSKVVGTEKDAMPKSSLKYFATNDRKLEKHHVDLFNHLVNSISGCPTNQPAAFSIKQFSLNDPFASRITPEAMFNSIKLDLNTEEEKLNGSEKEKLVKAHKAMIEKVEKNIRLDQKFWGPIRTTQRYLAVGIGGGGIVALYVYVKHIMFSWLNPFAWPIKITTNALNVCTLGYYKDYMPWADMVSFLVGLTVVLFFLKRFIWLCKKIYGWLCLGGSTSLPS